MRKVIRIVSAIFLIAGMILVGLAGDGTAQDKSAQDVLAEGRAAYMAGNFAGCADRYLQVIKAGADDATTYYDAACCLALSDRPELAIAHLRQAVERGYRDFTWLKNDTDLESLHSHKQWNDVLAAVKEAELAYRKSVNAELYDLFQADQVERMDDDADWDSVTAHDRQRRQRVRQLLDTGLVTTADDYFHAAMIFQHGTDSADYLRAHQLAQKSAALDSTNENALWLIAASKDRYLQSIGQPQWYGTQFWQVDGVWTIEPIDTTAVTDADRRELHVPTLEETRRHVAAMNK